MDEFALASFAGGRPMFGAEPPPAMALDFNAGLFGDDPLVALLGNALSSRAFAASGLVPAQFRPRRGLYDQYHAKDFLAEEQAALAAAAEGDRETTVRTLRGLAMLTGRPFGIEQERAARGLAGGVATAAPILARLMPETFDSLHGSRGSAAVMAQFVHRGGRFARDPISGETGLSGLSAAAVADAVRDRFGPGGGASAFRGLSLGRLGMLYDEAQARGVLGPSLADLPEAAQARAIAADPGALAAGLGRLPEGLRQAIVGEAEAAAPGARAAAEARAAADRVVADLRAADPGRFAALAAAAAPPRRPLAYLDPGRQVAELAAASAAPLGALPPARLEALAASLTGAQVARAALAADPANAALAAAPPGGRAQAMAALPPAARVRLLERLDPAAQRDLLDRLDDAQRAALGTPEASPAEAALERLGDAALARHAAAFEARTGRGPAGATAAARRAALAADPEAARAALEELRATDPAALAALAAGRVARAGSAEDLARSPAFVAEALEAIRRDRPDLYRRYERDGTAAAARNAAPEDGLKALPRDEQDRKVAEAEATARAAVDRIRRDAPEAFDDLKRRFDARRVAERLQSLAGVTAAMRDIFGDLGRPDAPMRELVEGLNQLTQGGLATQDKAALERSVRTTQELARATGVGMEGMMGLMARGAAIADGLGIEREFAVQGAQGAAAFGQAIGQSGRGDLPHFQAADREKMTLLDQRLRMQASKSGMSNQLAAAVRLVETMDDAGLGGRVGPRARALAEAVKDRRATFADGGDPAASVFLDETSFRALMADSGFREEDTVRTLLQADANRQRTARYGIGDLVRDHAQRDELKGFLAQSQRGPLADVVERLGLKGQARERAAMGAANAVADALLGMDGATLRDDKARTASVASAMRDALARQGLDAAKVPEADLRLAAEAGWGEWHEAVRRNPATRGYDSGLTAIEMQSRRVAARKDEVAQEAAAGAAMRSALAGLGQAGPLARVVDAIQAPPADLSQFLGRALGGLPPEEVRARLDRLKALAPQELRDAGITDRDRLGVMAERFATVARSFGSTRAVSDPAARAAQMRALQSEAEALIGDPAKARALIDESLRSRGLAPSDRDAAIRGEAGTFSADERGRLRALALAADKGITATAADAGMAPLPGTPAAEVAAAADRLEAAGPDRDAAGRAARLLVEGASEVASGLAADPERVRGLGEGGLGLARGLRDRRLRLQALADRKAGGDAAALLAAGDPEAAALRRALAADLKEVARRQAAAPGDLPAMGRRERDEAAAWRDELARPEPEQNRALVARLLRETGGDRLGEGDRAALAGAIGTGPAAEAARAAIGRGLDARGELDRLAAARGLDPARVRAAARSGRIEADLAGLPAADRRRAAALAEEAGPLLRPGPSDEGAAARSYREAIEAWRPRAAEPAAGGGPQAAGPQRVVGELRITGLDRGMLTARMEPAGSGTTPIPLTP